MRITTGTYGTHTANSKMNNNSDERRISLIVTLIPQDSRWIGEIMSDEKIVLEITDVVMHQRDDWQASELNFRHWAHNVEVWVSDGLRAPK